ncbi:SDR family oxidoreductase [Sphingomonas sp. PB2P12]|uniref:SDR family oxidoreductase n=1 Tax=Sphingomonas sandaracina TaxID=3096157 RepID=UPI002FC757B2
MQKQGNTILITGGGSGIGRALAHRWHDLGNTVIVVGRKAGPLDETVAGRTGMASYVLDVADPASIEAVAHRIISEHPDLNVLVNNAGASFAEDPTSARDLSDAEAMIATNLLGPIRIIDAFIEHLKIKQNAAIVNVSSGLAFVPYAPSSTYSATKAAVHSYTASLRALLKGKVEVIEIVPPQVATALTPTLKDSPYSVPLDDFADEVMALFDQQPPSEEIIVESVEPFRFAERDGKTNELIASMLPE